jgi:hypothetical protein
MKNKQDITVFQMGVSQKGSISVIVRLHPVNGEKRGMTLFVGLLQAAPSQ